MQQIPCTSGQASDRQCDSSDQHARANRFQNRCVELCSDLGHQTQAELTEIFPGRHRERIHPASASTTDFSILVAEVPTEHLEQAQTVDQSRP